MMAEAESRAVVVVGAGVAGLSAARELRRLGVDDVLLLEASDRLGGRVRTIDLGCGGLKAEGGAEFIHGKIDNPIVDLLKDAGHSLREIEWPNYAFLGKENVLCHEDELNMEIIEKAIDALPTESIESKENLLEYFVRHGVSSRLLDLADAIYANDWGASASEIGAKEAAFEQKCWNAGEAYLVLDETLEDSLLPLLKSETEVRFHAQVTDLSRPGYVYYKENRVIKTRCIIVAVSLGARAEITGIKPSASLPVANGLKVFLVVNNKFWPDDFWNVVAANCAFPEVWLSKSKPPHYLLVGFVMGQRADALARQGQAALKMLFLRQLDTMFASEHNPTPATSATVSFQMVDWASDPFAHGAYTYPSPGCLEVRKILSESISLSDSSSSTHIFFAGEAVNPHLNPCLQGAMLSGIEAANAAHSLLFKS